MRSHSHERRVVPAGLRCVVLVGNPNTGKSVLFGQLTRRFAEVSNYPGTTLFLSSGKVGDYILVDTPGVYGLGGGREEATVAEAVQTADLVVNVLDATNLERGLWLTLDLLEAGKPILNVLNMWDEVERSGMAVNREALAKLLGTPAYATVATNGMGMGDLVAGIKRQLEGPSPACHQAGTNLLVNEAGTVGLPTGPPLRASLTRRGRIEAILGDVVATHPRRKGISDKLSSLMIRPLTGVPLALGILGAVFYLIGTYVAQDLVGFTEGTVFQGIYEPAVRSLVGALLSGPLYEIVAGEFGVLTMTVTYVLGLLLPLVFAFYIMMAVLEDSGYLPRLATLADRTFTAMGMNGKAVIPIVLGFGCVTMATITTRMLGKGKERTIAVALLALAVPCSAQMAVILVLLAGLGLLYWALYGGIILAVFLLIGALLSHLIPGKRSDLIFELPKLRIPQLRNVLRKAYFRTWVFIKDVFPLFFFGALLISLLLVTGVLGALQEGMRPLVQGWLGLPAESSTALIMGFVRRDFGAAGFFHLDLTVLQAVVGMVVITLFTPCIASVMVIHKEMGLKGLIGILGFTLGTAFLVGGLVTRLFSLVLGG